MLIPMPLLLDKQMCVVDGWLMQPQLTRGQAHLFFGLGEVFNLWCIWKSMHTR